MTFPFGCKGYSLALFRQLSALPGLGKTFCNFPCEAPQLAVPCGGTGRRGLPGREEPVDQASLHGLQNDLPVQGPSLHDRLGLHGMQGLLASPTPTRKVAEEGRHEASGCRILSTTLQLEETPQWLRQRFLKNLQAEFQTSRKIRECRCGTQETRLR